MKKPFISIIVTCRNEERYIERCLKSILNQDYPKNKREIIVVDGMSEDNTIKIIKRFLKKDNFILMYNPKKTLSSAFNIGLKKSKGEIIIRIDSHAEFSRDYVTQCVLCLETTKADCVGGMQNSIGETKIQKIIAEVINSKFAGGRFHYLKKPGFAESVYLGAFRKNVFDKIGGFNEEIIATEDDEFRGKMVEKGMLLYLNPGIKSKYYCRDSLLKLFKQYFYYGLYKPKVLKLHPKIIRLRFFLPLILIIGLINSFLGIFNSFTRIFSIAFLLLYLGFLVYASLSIPKKSWKNIFYFPFVLISMQVGYGLGFLAGLFKK